MHTTLFRSSRCALCPFSEIVFLWEILCIGIVSTITVEPLESNTTCSGYSNIEDSMWHILSFEIVSNTKGLFLVWPLGGFFFFFQRLSLLVIYVCLAKSVVDALIHLSLTFISVESVCKNLPTKIRIIDEAKKRWVQNPSGGFFNFVKWMRMTLNVLGERDMSSWIEFI